MANRLMTKSEANAYCLENGYKLFIDMCIKEKIIVQDDPKVKTIYHTKDYADQFGHINIEIWPEGLVVWVGGEIRWKSWK